MPPKAKYTKEQIADAAFSIVRSRGMDALSARSLAAELGTSTAPIFTAFGSIEEISDAVTEKAKALYRACLESGLSQALPFKGAGMQYIAFAKNEPELFKLLFMGSDPGEEMTHFLPAHDENAGTVQKVLETSYNLPKEEARNIYNHLSVYTHGLAVLYAQGQCVFTMDDASRMLTEVFMALTGGKKQ